MTAPDTPAPQADTREDVEGLAARLGTSSNLAPWWWRASGAMLLRLYARAEAAERALAVAEAERNEARAALAEADETFDRAERGWSRCAEARDAAIERMVAAEAERDEWKAAALTAEFRLGEIDLRVMAAEAGREALRETNRRLHRRIQGIEGPLHKAVVDGMSAVLWAEVRRMWDKEDADKRSSPAQPPSAPLSGGEGAEPYAVLEQGAVQCSEPHVAMVRADGDEAAILCIDLRSKYAEVLSYGSSEGKQTVSLWPDERTLHLHPTEKGITTVALTGREGWEVFAAWVGRYTLNVVLARPMTSDVTRPSDAALAALARRDAAGREG